MLAPLPSQCQQFPHPEEYNASQLLTLPMGLKDSKERHSTEINLHNQELHSTETSLHSQELHSTKTSLWDLDKAIDNTNKMSNKTMYIIPLMSEVRNTVKGQEI